MSFSNNNKILSTDRELENISNKNIEDIKRIHKYCKLKIRCNKFNNK